MKLFSFKGGVHPPEMKGLAEDSPIQKAEIPENLTVPLVQHIGAPCKATVEVGQQVREGQIIGETQAFVTAPVHAPLSGKVKKIENMLHPLGIKVPTSRAFGIACKRSAGISHALATVRAMSFDGAVSASARRMQNFSIASVRRVS